MRLDELSVDDYGPLDEELQFGEGLQVVYGPNESGKTLLVDALLWLLTGQNDDDRVGQEPLGSVRLVEPEGSRRLDDGETVMDRLEAYHEVSIDARDFRNTFVVRSADSALTGEDEYYDRATDVVAESLVDDIERVRGAVRSAGRITPTGLFIDRSTEIETRTHHEEAKDLQERINGYLADADEIRQLEADYFEAESRVAEQVDEVERLREAKRRSEYETQSSNRDRLDGVLEKLAELPDEAALDGLEDEVDEALDTADEPEAVETRREEARDLARYGIVATVVALVASLAIGGWVLATLGLSLLGLVVIGFVVAILTAVPAAGTWYFWRVREQAQEQLSDLRTARSTALHRSRELGLEADDVEALAVEVERLQKRRDELRQEASTLMGQLNTGLDLGGDDPAETLELATDELERREPDLPDVVDGEYSAVALEDAEAELSELEDRRDELAGELEEVRSAISGFTDDVADIPFGAYDLERPQTNVTTLEGLEGLRDGLEELIERIEMDADNARVADDLLGDLVKTERRRVGQLFFGAESTVSKYFSHITDGRYEEVEYDEVNNVLRVRTRGDDVLSPGQLSQSTFDQLYLSVRLAFAQELLDKAAGFLVLDDAFLASDAARLERQIEILDDLVDRGWQVVYFTAKEYDREVLGNRPGADSHTLELLRP